MDGDNDDTGSMFIDCTNEEIKQAIKQSLNKKKYKTKTAREINNAIKQNVIKQMTLDLQLTCRKTTPWILFVSKNDVQKYIE